MRTSSANTPGKMLSVTAYTEKTVNACGHIRRTMETTRLQLTEEKASSTPASRYDDVPDAPPPNTPPRVPLVASVSSAAEERVSSGYSSPLSGARSPRVSLAFSRACFLRWYSKTGVRSRCEKRARQAPTQSAETAKYATAPSRVPSLEPANAALETTRRADTTRPEKLVPPMSACVNRSGMVPTTPNNEP